MAKPKIEPRLPKGMRDFLPAQMIKREYVFNIVREVFHLYGFEPLQTPSLELTETLMGKYGEDADKLIYNARHTQGKEELSLRYDLTVPLARVVGQYQNDISLPFKRYQLSPVWRAERPQRGRYREFYQCDADTVGSASVAADAEICAMLADALEAVGIPRGDYVVKVNNRKVLNGVMEVAGVLAPADPEKFAHERGIVLRAIDKFDKFGDAGVRALIGAGRMDESGDFTKGAGLSDEQADTVMGFMNARAANNEGTILKLMTLVSGSAVGQEGVHELQSIADLLAAQGYGPDRIVIDPSVVRGLGYYTGPVYEAELTFEILDEKGRKRQFGSVAGGGRYDDLVKRFTGQSVPATGVSIGVDRLLAALRAKGRIAADTRGPVVVTVMDRDRMADYQAMATDLRRAGIRAEVYLGNPKNFGNQLKYADKRNSPVAIIQGGDEAARGVVQVKDLFLGARIAAEASHEEWKAQPAQTEVARDALVTEVRRILGQG